MTRNKEPQTEPITDMNSETQVPLPKMLVLLLVAIPLVVAWAAFLVRPDIAETSFGAIIITAVFVVCIVLPDRWKDAQVVDMDQTGLAVVEFRGRRRDFRWEEITELRCRHNLGRRRGLGGYIRLRAGRRKAEINFNFPALDRMIDFAVRACREKGVGFVDESVPAAISDEHHPGPKKCPLWVLIGLTCLPFVGFLFTLDWTLLLLCAPVIALAAFVRWIHLRDYRSRTHPLKLRTIEVNETGILMTTHGEKKTRADWPDIVSVSVDVWGPLQVETRSATLEIGHDRFDKLLEIANVVTDYCLKKGIRLDHKEYGRFNYPE